ncbi:hypothetical protein [Streptomyces sp. NPDC047070]|uniref:hypothetical protein n=1 Tax=Streptomyces sp. NPDC047070 TaxID=3154923 RepID=UPI003452C894
MAMRGSPRHRVQGNPLGGILRNLERQARSTTTGTARSRTPTVRVPPAEAEPGPRGLPGPPGRPGIAGDATVVVTGKDGRARWQYSESFAVAPVITAVAVDPDPGGEQTVTVALEEVEAAYAVVRVWRTRPRRGQGVALPADAGVSVHMAAMRRPQ